MLISQLAKRDCQIAKEKNMRLTRIKKILFSMMFVPLFGVFSAKSQATLVLTPTNLTNGQSSLFDGRSAFFPSLPVNNLGPLGFCQDKACGLSKLPDLSPGSNVNNLPIQFQTKPSPPVFCQ